MRQQNLQRIMSSLPTADGNLACAAVSTSYVSSWEKSKSALSMIIPKRYRKAHIIQVVWQDMEHGELQEFEKKQLPIHGTMEMKLTGADIYLWYDSDTEGDYNKGVEFKDP